MNSAVAVARSFVEALKAKDLTIAKLAPDVRFESPLTEKPLRGPKELEDFLSPIFPLIADVRIKKEISQAEDVCIFWELTTKDGTVVPILEHFQVSNEAITEIRPYFDPRPLTGGQ